MRFEVDALLFDMDGTLVDSTGSVLRSWATVAAEFAIPADLYAAVPRHGRPSVEILADLVPRDVVAPAAARLDELELTDTADVTLLPGAAALLAAAPPGRWAVVTSAGRELARVRLAAAGIVLDGAAAAHAAPPRLVTIDDVSRGKPDPEPFLLGAKLLGVSPERCLVFEDAPAGLAAARAAGASTIAVTTTHTADQLDADLVVPDLTGIRVEQDGDGRIIVLRR
jgi:mannitol-1-/sugar-/sorbitol-6-phosphatase